MEGMNKMAFNYCDCAPSSIAFPPLWYLAHKFNDQSLLYGELMKLNDGRYTSYDSPKYFPMAIVYASKFDLNSIAPPEEKVWSGKGINPVVLVHGDTSTTFVTALACFYLQIPVGHVEAGLRTHNIYSPFPEEFNRQAVGIISQYNFAPTTMARDNLLREGKPAERIYVTGNTAIDALKTTVRASYTHPELEWAEGSRLILITAHRRENLGEPMKHMFRAIRRVCDEHPDVKAIYPIHMNPAVREIASEILGDDERIRMIEPLDVLDFHNFLSRSYLILTDSGGIQEEAPSLGKPVLVMRDTTERPEGIAAGTLKLVGTEEETIYNSFKELLENPEVYHSMSTASNPYGDGLASKRIADILQNGKTEI